MVSTLITVLWAYDGEYDEGSDTNHYDGLKDLNGLQYINRPNSLP